MREIWRMGKYNIIYYTLPFLVGIFCVVFSLVNFFIFQVLSLVLAVLLILGVILVLNGLPLLKTIKLTQNINNSKFGIVRLEQYSILKFGRARSGKTLTAVAECVYSALALYSDLQKKYYAMSKLIQLFEYYSDEVFVIRFLEIKRSFEFWQHHADCIPCLFSNVKITYNGLKSMDLSVSHLSQDKWLPSFTMLFVDEIGRFLGVEKSTEKSAKINDFICWIGQFCECHLICTEQRPTNIMIDLRGVLGVNERVVKMSKIHTAYLLNIILNKLDLIAIRRGMSPAVFKILKRCRDFANRVGFLAFEIELMGNMDFKSDIDTKHIKIYLLANTEFNYDSRAFQNLWLATDLADSNTSVSSMLVDVNSEIAQSIYARYVDDVEVYEKDGKIYRKKTYFPH